MADLTVTATKVAAVYPTKADIVPVRLAETVTAGQAAYATSSGAFGLADANASGKQQFRGIFLQGGTSGEVVNVLREGEIEGFTISSLNTDAKVYLSDTAGALADAAGTMTVIAGRVVGIPSGNASYNKALYIKADWLRDWS